MCGGEEGCVEVRKGVWRRGRVCGGEEGCEDEEGCVEVMKGVEVRKVVWR